jgi:hypothetical protein
METYAGGTGIGTDVNTATADFSTRGWELTSEGPVFSGLPEGVTVNIPGLNVFNNQWLGPIVGVSTAGPSFALAPLRNPIRGTGRLSLTLPVAGPARVEVFDVTGARIATLLDGWRDAGNHTVEWATGAGHPGVFFVRATFQGQSVTQRVVVVR